MPNKVVETASITEWRACRWQLQGGNSPEGGRQGLKGGRNLSVAKGWPNRGSRELERGWAGEQEDDYQSLAWRIQKIQI